MKWRCIYNHSVYMHISILCIYAYKQTIYIFLLAYCIYYIPISILYILDTYKHTVYIYMHISIMCVYIYTDRHDACSWISTYYFIHSWTDLKVTWFLSANQLMIQSQKYLTYITARSVTFAIRCLIDTTQH